MQRAGYRIANILMWVFALATALATLRYFAPSPRWLFPFQIAVLLRNRFWFSAHVGSGIITLVLGLLQFSARLRAARPGLHRLVGYIYVAAIFIGGIAGLRLAPDTPLLLSEGLTEEARMQSVYGLNPSNWGIAYGATYTPAQFSTVVYSFALLALTWMFVNAVALRYAVRRDFTRHQQWMIRSYSLTFAAFTVRLAAAVLVLLFREPVLASNLALWSWIVNLTVAEWIIRRSRRKPLAFAAHV